MANPLDVREANASHILEWAHNSFPLYNRMQRLQVSNSGGPEYRAFEATSIAHASVREMVSCREIKRGEYSVMDILDAAKLIAAWAGEE